VWRTAALGDFAGSPVPRQRLLRHCAAKEARGQNDEVSEKKCVRVVLCSWLELDRWHKQAGIFEDGYGKSRLSWRPHQSACVNAEGR